MKVCDLIKTLQTLDPEMQLIIQKDSEGNGYSPLCGLDGEALYVPESTWSGIAYHLDSTAEDNDLSDEEWEIIKSDPKFRAGILFPVN